MEESIKNQDIVNLDQSLNELPEGTTKWDNVKKVEISEKGAEEVVQILQSLGAKNQIEELTLDKTVNIPGIEKCIPQETLRTLVLFGDSNESLPIGLTAKLSQCRLLSHLEIRCNSLKSLKLPHSLTELYVECDNMDSSFFQSLTGLPNLHEFCSDSKQPISEENVAQLPKALTDLIGHLDTSAAAAAESRGIRLCLT